MRRYTSPSIKERFSIRPLHVRLSALVILGATAACGGVPLPSTSPATISTIVAATLRALTPTTVAPLSASPTATRPAPTATITIIPLMPSATATPVPRINFDPGASSGVVTGSIGPSELQSYVLQASQGQPMLVQLDSPNHDLALGIRTQGGTSLLSTSARQQSWRGALPRTEDYYLTVVGGSLTQDYTLTIKIAERIIFKEGADSATRSGKTVGGSIAVYSLLALKGQKMAVSLSHVGDNAVLSIYGFVDDQPYLVPERGETYINFTLPATQDYIIEIVPKDGKTVPYVLDVKVE